MTKYLSHILITITITVLVVSMGLIIFDKKIAVPDQQLIESPCYIITISRPEKKNKEFMCHHYYHNDNVFNCYNVDGNLLWVLVPSEHTDIIIEKKE